MYKPLITPLVLLVVVFGALFLLPFEMINWGNVTTNPASQVVVTGYAQSEEANQIATFYLTINSINVDKAVAVEDLTNRTNELVTKMRDFGIPEGDMKTQNITIWQDERYNPTTGETTNGDWRATNSIEVKLKDVIKVQDFSDLMATSGVDNLSGPNYSVDTTTAMADDLIGQAMENAKIKAEEIAKASGKQLGEVIAVQEGSSGGSISPSPMMERSMGGGGGPDLMPGTSQLTKSVTVIYNLK